MLNRFKKVKIRRKAIKNIMNLKKLTIKMLNNPIKLIMHKKFHNK